MVYTDSEDSDFISEWENKKKSNDALHKRAYNKMKDIWCIFSRKKSN